MIYVKTVHWCIFLKKKALSYKQVACVWLLDFSYLLFVFSEVKASIQMYVDSNINC